MGDNSALEMDPGRKNSVALNRKMPN